MEAGTRRDAIFMQQGITFDAAGPDADGPVHDRPFPLDLVPRIIPAEEWEHIEKGLEQRIRALNAFVDDVYHGREIVHEGLDPVGADRQPARPSAAPRTTSARRAASTATSRAATSCAGADGVWRVLEDNVRTPSGISYVLENRNAMTRLLPRLFADYKVRPVDHYPTLLRRAIDEVAPTGSEEEPTSVVWTPGPFNSAYFEHAFLARQMGVELVEATDLVVHDATCFMRTTSGLQRVHAIYRRIDDDYMDPLEFRPDSMLGVPGLMRAYRSGTLTLINAVGTGVADDKAIYHYVPEMVRFYLGEEPVLENVTTYLLSDREQRQMVLGRLGELVVKPTSESGGKGVFIGPTSTEEEQARQAEEIRREPERWIAQELVNLSTVPTAMSDGTLQPRHVDLRPFAVMGEKVRIIPGGLTRVALREGSMIVNSSQGGGSKDTWVLEDDVGRVGDQPTSEWMPVRMPGMNSGGDWVAQQQQQQQQQAGSASPDRPRAVLDRPPHVARRAHRAHARRRLPRRPAGAAGQPRPVAAELGHACWRSWARRRRTAPPSARTSSPA